MINKDKILPLFELFPRKRITLKEFFKITYSATGQYDFDNFKLRPYIFCCDGFGLSVQGSAHHHSTPKRSELWYATLEVGCLSEREVALDRFAEEQPINLEKTIYPYVPVGIINRVIEKHDGIDFERTFAGCEIYENFNIRIND